MSEKRKAWLRSVRTAIQAVVTTGIVAGLRVAAQAVMTAKGWGELDVNATVTASVWTAVLASVTYSWNRWLDPSRVPSLVVPED